VSVNDPRHWQDRAENMRALAEQMQDADSKQSMLNIADEYEKLAKRAEGRSDGRLP
jgi:hypothetical protein